ncbi:MAG TPA: HEPN domain-containing protein [Thermoanaerobaculia bacterium]|nr:HEPN domain-containing protein [Thermoanaerobaculia bacterium]
MGDSTGQAGASRDDQSHEWACFAAQQSAENAAKALRLYLGQEVRGHVVARLLAELPVEVERSLIDKAKVLDNFYIGTRYPNVHSEGPPFEHYGEIQSGNAIRYAHEILAFVRARVA